MSDQAAAEESTHLASGITSSNVEQRGDTQDPLTDHGQRRLLESRWINTALWVVIAISPALVVTFLVRHYFNASLLDFTPVMSDEIDYWHQAATFRTVGFAGGVYGVDETHAEFPFLHFGSHGPAYPMLLAGIGSIAGWRPFSGPVINMAVIAVAIFSYLALTRAGRMRAVLTGVLVLTFWPLMLYLTTTMQETFHQAFAAALAGLFFLLLRRGPDTSRTFYTAAVALLALASLLRPTWALLFVPLFFLRGAELSGRRLRWAAVKASPIIVAAFWVSSAVSTPYPGFVAQLTELATRSPLAAVKLFLWHFCSSTKKLAEGNWLELGLRAALLLIVVAAITGVVRHLRGSDADHREGLAARTFHLLNLVPLLILLMGVYDIFDWRDYRVLAPHVLLSALVALARSERTVVISAVATNVAVVGAVGPIFSEIHYRHFVPVDTKTTALSRYLAYKPGASAWENTILVDRANFGPGLVNVPAGLGLTLHLRENDQTVRSRYLLVTEATALKLRPDRLRLLTTTDQGNLYIRKD
ncbi:hypothetical protein NE236_26485 [Actinoallomurus purpureus]|uniref:hypothetical protein n=1 Tax=Actinoallomurus purpureus TaxID=478114 RepID=UPI0020929A9D|nr:hypothetical protein [Actinoallomurus purpureus]MCO6008526.1 hypothetical protein [Actinoallomurus purpureus]